MATDAQIRARLVAIVDEQLARYQLGAEPLTRGARVLRRGRYVLCTTSKAGWVLFGIVTRDLKGINTLIGPVASVRQAVPPTLRQAWIDGASGEAADDPVDGD